MMPTADVGGHSFAPHPDPELARKGWLRCAACGREVHGSLRAGGWPDRCRCELLPPGAAPPGAAPPGAA
jgi:hypothetical protein